MTPSVNMSALHILAPLIFALFPVLASADGEVPHPPGSPPAGWFTLPGFRVPKYVPENADVTLSCDYKLHPGVTLYSLKWYKAGAQFYQYIPKNPRQHAAHTVPGLKYEQVLGEGAGRTVLLRAVTAAASGQYRCEMVAEGPPFHTTQRESNMTVVILPKGDPIVTRTRDTYQMDDIITLNCTAPLSKPAVELSWTVNGVPVTDSSVKLLEHFINPAGLEKVTSRLQLHVTRRHFKSGDMVIVCNARLGDGLYARADSITVTDPSKGWFVSGNLYLTSGCCPVLQQVSCGLRQGVILVSALAIVFICCQMASYFSPANTKQSLIEPPASISTKILTVALVSTSSNLQASRTYQKSTAAKLVPTSAVPYDTISSILLGVFR